MRSTVGIMSVEAESDVSRVKREMHSSQGETHRSTRKRIERLSLRAAVPWWTSIPHTYPDSMCPWIEVRRSLQEIVMCVCVGSPFQKARQARLPDRENTSPVGCSCTRATASSIAKEVEVCIEASQSSRGLRFWKIISKACRSFCSQRAVACSLTRSL